MLKSIVVLNRTIIFVETKQIIMKEKLIKDLQELQVERKENAEIYSEETLTRLSNLINKYQKLIISL